LIAKIHPFDLKTILAVCDKELVGKEFEDGKIFFRASEKFFGTNQINEKDLIQLALEADSINLFGNKCVGILQKEGLISENSVILISGIKHAQIYRL
jgi:hypothetical protein